MHNIPSGKVTTSAPTSDLDPENIASLGKADRSALRSGLVSHSEHAVDLILVQGALPGDQLVQSFSAVCRQLVSGLARGSLGINEKIDGSPAIVLGFTADNRPFVAYKGGIDRKTRQQIFTCTTDVERAFKEEDPRRALYGALVKNVLPAMNKVPAPLRRFTYQCDRLFHAGDTRMTVTDDAVTFTPNTVTYKVSADHPLYRRCADASVALVGHTISICTHDPKTSRIEPSAHYDPESLQAFLQAIDGKDVLALHPYHEVRIPSSRRAELGHEIEPALARLSDYMANVSEEFRSLWATAILPSFRKFINSSVHPGRDGGLFSMAAEGARFSPAALIRRYRALHNETYAALERGDPSKRGAGILVRNLKIARNQHGESFEALLNAYYEAIKIQRRIDQVLKPAIGSKLGGGPVEGIMLSEGDIFVKWVDRLDFTRKNNENNERGRGDGGRWREMETLPAPFDVWKPGAVVLPMKLQPPHAGHIQMIREVKAKYPGREVIVLASDKQANLAADHWKALGLAETKHELAAGIFTHPFSIELRRELLQTAIGDDCTITVTSPSIFRDYLRRAREAGETQPVVLAVGAKEKKSGSYDGDLKTYKGLVRPHYVSPKEGGISGTAIKRALRDGEHADPALLELALSYINDNTLRQSYIDRMMAEYRSAAERAAEVLAAEAGRKSATKKAATTKPVAKKVAKVTVVRRSRRKAEHLEE